MDPSRMSQPKNRLTAIPPNMGTMIKKMPKRMSAIPSAMDQPVEDVRVAIVFMPTSYGGTSFCSCGETRCVGKQQGCRATQNCDEIPLEDGYEPAPQE